MGTTHYVRNVDSSEMLPGGYGHHTYAPLPPPDGLPYTGATSRPRITFSFVTWINTKTLDHRGTAVYSSGM